MERNEKCIHCNSIELDGFLKSSFFLNVCENCRQVHSDRYSLITKTTAREEFLLTEEELADKEHLPFITKPNPHKSTWSDMHLYLRENVINFSIKKWGSLEALEKEINAREAAKEARKEKRFKEKLKELKRKTRSSAIKNSLSQPNPERHRHSFDSDSNNNGGQRICKICGIKIEQEEF